MTVAAATEAGGVMLPPGDYEVREVESRSGAVVEFARQVHNELASELVQADEEEIVARLNFTGQALSGAPKHTQLRLAASNSTDAVGLEIRGSAVGYVFARSTLSAASDTSDTAAACATDGTNR